MDGLGAFLKNRVNGYILAGKGNGSARYEDTGFRLILLRSIIVGNLLRKQRKQRLL